MPLRFFFTGSDATEVGVAGVWKWSQGCELREELTEGAVVLSNMVPEDGVCSAKEGSAALIDSNRSVVAYSTMLRRIVRASCTSVSFRNENSKISSI